VKEQALTDPNVEEGALEAIKFLSLSIIS